MYSKHSFAIPTFIIPPLVIKTIFMVYYLIVQLFYLAILAFFKE